MLKSDSATDLIKAVEALQLNRTFFNSGIERIVLEGYLNGGGPSFSEREVVQLLAEGKTTRKTTKEVAFTLGLSVKTAEAPRSNIMRKLNLHSVSELVLYAVRNDIIHVPTPYATVEMPLAATGD